MEIYHPCKNCKADGHEIKDVAVTSKDCNCIFAKNSKLLSRVVSKKNDLINENNKQENLMKSMWILLKYSLDITIEYEKLMGELD